MEEHRSDRAHWGGLLPVTLQAKMRRNRMMIVSLNMSIWSQDTRASGIGVSMKCDSSQFRSYKRKHYIQQRELSRGTTFRVKVQRSSS